MKKRLSVLLIACLVLAAVLLSACNDAKSLLGKANKSVANATSLKYSLSVTDSGVVVYSYDKTVTVDGDNATVTVDEATLGKDFTLQHAVTTNTSAKADQLVLPLGITEENLSSYEVSGDLLTCVISKEEFAGLFNSSSLVSADDVTVMFVFNEGKCKQMICNYTTETAKAVSMTVSCEY